MKQIDKILLTVEAGGWVHRISLYWRRRTLEKTETVQGTKKKFPQNVINVSKHYKMILYLWNKNENQKKKIRGPVRPNMWIKGASKRKNRECGGEDKQQIQYNFPELKDINWKTKRASRSMNGKRPTPQHISRHFETQGSENIHWA